MVRRTVQIDGENKMYRALLDDGSWTKWIKVGNWKESIDRNFLIAKGMTNTEIDALFYERGLIDRTPAIIQPEQCNAHPETTIDKDGACSRCLEESNK
jgi:hypothetical protein